MPSRKYKRIGSSNGLFRQSIFLGDDHLLIVDGVYKEAYRRLFFSDIQALISGPTSRTLVVLTFSGLTLSATTLAFLAQGFAWGWLVIMLPTTALIAQSLWGGGSREFAIKTAFQLVRLSAVGNRRAAQKLEDQLSPEIERVQGRLSSDTLRHFNTRAHLPTDPPSSTLQTD